MLHLLPASITAHTNKRRQTTDIFAARLNGRTVYLHISANRFGETS